MSPTTSQTVIMVLPLVNKPNVTDLKLRSEKYKSELASKLARIKNDLNGKDSKIESLLNKIGGCS